jgi:hypothetical protein
MTVRVSPVLLVLVGIGVPMVMLPVKLLLLLPFLPFFLPILYHTLQIY